MRKEWSNERTKRAVKVGPGTSCLRTSDLGRSTKDLGLGGRCFDLGPWRRSWTRWSQLRILERSHDQAIDFMNLTLSTHAGPDDYDVALPATSDLVEVDEQNGNDIWSALINVSYEIHEGEVFTKQAYYKAQIRQHEEGEEGEDVGLIIKLLALVVCG